MGQLEFFDADKRLQPCQRRVIRSKPSINSCRGRAWRRDRGGGAHARRAQEELRRSEARRPRRAGHSEQNEADSEHCSERRQAA